MIPKIRNQWSDCWFHCCFSTYSTCLKWCPPQPHILPAKLPWNLKIFPLKRKFIFQISFVVLHKLGPNKWNHFTTMSGLILVWGTPCTIFPGRWSLLNKMDMFDKLHRFHAAWAKLHSPPTGVYARLPSVLSFILPSNTTGSTTINLKKSPEQWPLHLVNKGIKQPSYIGIIKSPPGNLSQSGWFMSYTWLTCVESGCDVFWGDKLSIHFPLVCVCVCV